MRLTIEKVLILKSVNIFSKMPDDVLMEVTSILEEIEVEAGENIFQKGDVGTSMYIVIRGQVRVHDGERTLATLKDSEVFGELAVLDTEPRAASVTAVANTSLFRLEQNAFYELMTEHIEVVRGLFRVFCKRFREKS